MKEYFLKPSNPYKTTEDTYLYKYDEYVDSLAGRKEYHVQIIFVNGKFDRLNWLLDNNPRHFNKMTMELLNLIQDEIKKLEKNYK